MINGKYFPKAGLFEVTKKEVGLGSHIMDEDKNGFFYCRRGNVVIEMDDKTYEVKEKGIFLYMPFSELYIKEMSDDASGFIGVTEFSFIYSSLHIFANSFNYMHFKENPCCNLSEDGCRRVEELIFAINERKGHIGGPIAQQLVNSLANALCYQIMYEYVAEHSLELVMQDRKDLIFKDFMKSLYANYTTHREVNFYAAEQCLSPRYFSSIIKTKTGRTAQQWISMVLITEARNLLDDASNSVKDVAFQLGFPNQSFFGRYFKQYYGKSPSVYRREVLSVKSDV